MNHRLSHRGYRDPFDHGNFCDCTFEVNGARFRSFGSWSVRELGRGAPRDHFAVFPRGCRSRQRHRRRVMEHHLLLRWDDRFHMAIQERCSKYAIHREVGNDQELYTRDDFTDPDVQRELAYGLHGLVRSVDERRAPCGFDDGAPRLGDTPLMYQVPAGPRMLNRHDGSHQLMRRALTRVAFRQFPFLCSSVS